MQVFCFREYRAQRRNVVVARHFVEPPELASGGVNRPNGPDVVLEYLPGAVFVAYADKEYRVFKSRLYRSLVVEGFLFVIDGCARIGFGLKKVQARLQTLHDLGLGYLTLGEPTPALSGGEAQRLKLASEMGRVQDDAVFVFDEPTIGLHPLDVQVLLSVFDGLVAKGATVVVIEHDLDLIRNADYVIDMGPGGGDAGGQIVCAGTPADIAACSKSITARYL